MKAAGALRSLDGYREHPRSAKAVPVRIDVDGIPRKPPLDVEDGGLVAREELVDHVSIGSYDSGVNGEERQDTAMKKNMNRTNG